MAIPIFVVSLEDEHARRRPLLEALQKNGLEFEVFWAVDGRQKLPSEFESLIDRNAAKQNLYREMGDAEFACAISHHQIYITIAARNLPWSIVLEDDVQITDAFVRFANLETLPDKEFLLLDHSRTYVTRKGSFEIDGNTAYRVKQPPYRATGYALSLNAAEFMISNSLPIQAPADWPIDISKLDTWALTPRLVSHPPEETAQSNIRRERINSEAVNYRKRFLKAGYWARKWDRLTAKRIS